MVHVKSCTKTSINMAGKSKLRTKSEIKATNFVKTSQRQYDILISSLTQIKDEKSQVNISLISQKI